MNRFNGNVTVACSARLCAYGKTLLLCVASLSPFATSAWVFIQHGIPDILPAGDGAALELATLHAGAGTQLVGAYSRFGWNHPGPAFFYLALPIYELCERRGAALNLSALIFNAIAAILIVLEGRQLRGMLFATFVAALLAVFSLVGVPFLLANHWNPIIPILPLGLLFFLAVRLAFGATSVLPLFALIASFAVQSHVGYVPAVLALCAVPLAYRIWPAHAGRGTASLKVTKRWPVLATFTVLMLCWGPPLYEVAINPPGNLVRVIGFFALGPSFSHSWGTAIRVVAEQMAIMPWAILQAVAQRAISAPDVPLSLGIALTELLALVALLVFSTRRGDQVVHILSSTALIQVVVAIVAVKAIRGEIHSYLIAWVSLIGFWALLPAVASVPAWRSGVSGAVVSRAIVTTAALLLIGLALASPVPRSPVIDPSHQDVEQIAQQTEAYLVRSAQQTPTVRVASPDAWPIAVGVVLYLHKNDVPIFVEREWLYVVGHAFAAPPGRHPILLFGDQAFATRALERADLVPVTQTARFSVFLQNVP